MLDGSQKEGRNFFNLLQKERNTQKGGGRGSNPEENHDLSLLSQIISPFLVSPLTFLKNLQSPSSQYMYRVGIKKKILLHEKNRYSNIVCKGQV